MYTDRKLRIPNRILMALPIAALAFSLAACSGASRPTVDQVSAGLADALEEQGLGDALPDTAADCFAGYLVDSDLSNESLNHIANGDDLVASEDSTLAQQIIQDNLAECTS